MRTAKTFLSNVRKKKAGIAAIDIPLLDMSRVEDLIGTIIADLVLQVLSFASQTRQENIQGRQAQGIVAAKDGGVKFERPEVPTPKNFWRSYENWNAVRSM